MFSGGTWSRMETAYNIPIISSLWSSMVGFKAHLRVCVLDLRSSGIFVLFRYELTTSQMDEHEMSLTLLLSVPFLLDDLGLNGHWLNMSAALFDLLLCNTFIPYNYFHFTFGLHYPYGGKTLMCMEI